MKHRFQILALLLLAALVGCGGEQTIIAEQKLKLERVQITPVNDFGRVVPDAPVFIDELLEGYGPQTLTLDISKPHIVRGGVVRKYSKTPTQFTLAVDDATREIKLIYGGDNLAEVCFIPLTRNAREEEELVTAVDNIIVNGKSIIDQQEDGTFCEAVDTNKEVRASSFQRGSLDTSELAIPASELRAGKSKTYKLYHVESSRAVYYCTLTTPVRGEIFVANRGGSMRSVGWQLSNDLLCTVVDKQSETSFLFGRVNGAVPAVEIEFAALKRLPNSGAYETAIGWYNRATTDLHCVSAKGPWGPGSVQPSFIKIDGKELVKPYDRSTCTALTPHFEHQLECGPALYNDLVAQATKLIPPNLMQPGQVFSHTCEYKEKTQPETPQPTEPPKPVDDGYRSIEIQFFNEFLRPDGRRYRQMASYRIDGVNPEKAQEGRGNVAFWNGKIDDLKGNGLSFQITEPYLRRASIGFSQSDLRALDRTSSHYNRDRNVWFYEVYIGSDGPSILACGYTSANGVVHRTPGVWFNTLEADIRDEAGEACRVISVNVGLTGAFGWYQSGYRTPHPQFYPAGQFAALAGSRVKFIGRYIPENRVADLLVGTLGFQGQVSIMDGTGVHRSVGFSASSNGQTDVRIIVDITERNVLSFSQENGVQPGSVTFVSNNPRSPDGPGTLRWQSSTQVVGCYLQTCPTPAPR